MGRVFANWANGSHGVYHPHRAWVVLLGICAVTLTTPAWAYVPTVTQAGVGVTWRGEFKVNLAGNPVNQSGIDASSFRSAVVRSLQRWQAASNGQVGFDYWQGTHPDIYLPDSEYNGLSSIYFTSNSKTDPHLSPNILGLTQVWYDATSGKILETDIALNDRSFHFTTDPRDTTGYGSGGPTGQTGGLSKVFIENVLTHELGHVLGLSHGAALQSTMLFMESPEQAHLGCDEQVGIHALYAATEDAGTRGAITGSVVADDGHPVFGAHIVAISRRRGTALATALTDANGQYRISALEPGGYFLMVEPYYAGPSSLPTYYASMKSGLCGGGGDFARAFLGGGDGVVPTEVRVAGGAVAQAPALLAHCEGERGASVRMAAVGLDDAPLVLSGGENGFGATGRLDHLKAAYYKLHAVSGHLELHAVTYSLYSPVRAELRLLDDRGRRLEAAQVRAEQKTYSGDSGYVNYDSVLIADGLEAGDYTIEVEPAAVDVVRYPAGNLALDSASFMLLTGSLNESAPPLEAVLPVNGRCRMSEDFAAYNSPPGDPPRLPLGGAQSDGTGFCGTLARSDSDSTPPRGPGPGAVAGWLLPWAAMIAFARMAKLLARRAASG